MKTLHYQVYQNGNVGMCNILMSIENALLIAKLTNRDKIIFYCNHHIFNSENKLTIFDVYNINYNYEVSKLDVDESITSLQYDFHSGCIYNNDTPTKDFLNGRTNIININDYKQLEEFRTLNSSTLAYYSYLFYLSNHNERKVLQDWLKETLKPKDVYINQANQIVKSVKEIYKGFNSIHVRRGDYLYTQNTKNKDVNVIDFNLTFPKDELLIINTDEKDETYFKDLDYPNVWFIDKSLTGDTVEKGIISMLVSSHSNDFVGSMFSTFTGYIQRYRMYNGLKEDFKYLYSQRDNLKLVNNRIPEDSFGENTWNRNKLPDDLKQIAFWFREWQESYYQNSLPQIIKAVPDFVDEETINYIMSKATSTEYFQRENRNRTVLDNINDPIINKLVKDACKVLNYNYDNIEYGLQVFTQYKGGETFLHTDSVFEDVQGKRIASVLFYLNDDFEGSYIDFPYIGIRIVPKKGMMITYPLINEWNEQDKRWSHSASVITKGTKVMCYFSIKEKPRN